jgi:RNA polymerase sigma-54 factor
MLKIGQHQTLQQKLTPQQIQYLKLLQIPVIQLEQKIKEELEQNPFLEEGLEASPEEVIELELGENQEVEQAVKQELAEEYEETTQEILPKPDEEYTFEDFVKSLEDEDLSYKSGNFTSDDEEEIPWQPPALESLEDKLLQQLAPIVNEKEYRIAEEILGNIDDDGYLTRSVEEIAEDLRLGEKMEVTPEEVENVLKKIQRLDPPGIGARDLKECLLAQLEVGDFPEDKKTFAIRILNEAYDDFMKKRYDELMKKFNISVQKLGDVLQIIQRLNPKPGEGRAVIQEYIVPDFIVERVGDDFVITLNEKNVPMIRLNRTYYNLLKRQKKLPAEVKDEIKKQFARAKWFIASIYQRRETLLKIMRAIVELQREFFETGENLKPMIYKDVAEKAGVDISTVSRAVNQKYVQMDFGIYRLRDLFSEKVNTSNGTEVSIKELKEKIKQIIEQEDPRKPLTDDQIAEILRSQGFNIARRTVAKYRDQLGIPTARLRRRIE